MSTDIGMHWPRHQNPDAPSPSEYCEQHGLIPELVPFGHRNYDPWEMLLELDEGVRDLPQTAGTFRLGRLLDDTHAKNNYWRASVETVARLLGAWPHNHPRRGESTWVNPHYIHERALAPADVESREAHVLKCADAAVFDISDIAARFDIDAHSLEQWVARNDVGWSDRRRAARAAMGRTLTTTAAWTGRTQSELIEPLPVAYETARCWIREHVNQSDWETPIDPSRERGFES